MVVRFGQVIPTGQAAETTEVVSLLDPSFRKVSCGMWGICFSEASESGDDGREVRFRSASGAAGPRGWLRRPCWRRRGLAAAQSTRRTALLAP